MRSHKKYSMDLCLNWLMKTMSKTTYLKLHELSSHCRNGNIWGIAIQKYSMRICSFNMVSSSHLMHGLAACCCNAALVYVNFVCKWKYLCNGVSSNKNVLFACLRKGNFCCLFILTICDNIYAMLTHPGVMKQWVHLDKEWSLLNKSDSMRYDLFSCTE